MRHTLLLIPLIILLGGCWPFSKKTPLPDKRTGIPGSAQVNNYLDQAVTPQSVHCLEQQASTPPSERTYFHNDYAKISTNLVGRDVSFRWDESWNTNIGNSIENEYPEFLDGTLDPSSDELSSLGCSGYKDASKKDKKRFWALFLATIARAQSGFDPSFKEGNARGLFSLDPSKVSSVGGSCAGKDEWDFMEPSYSFSCVLEMLKKQISATGKLFSPIKTENFLLDALTGNKRGEFFKFFKAHAAPQFSFCTPDFEAPPSLVTTNVEGEKVTEDCTPESADRVYEGLDRQGGKGSGEGITSGDNNPTIEPEKLEALPESALEEPSLVAPTLVPGEGISK